MAHDQYGQWLNNLFCMKHILVCLLAATTLSAFGQGALKQSDSGTRTPSIGRITLFKQAVSQRQRPTLEQLDKYALLESDARMTDLVLDKQPEEFSMVLPGPEGEMELELQRVELLTPDFQLQFSSGGPTLEGTSGVFYRGHIKGQPNSTATLSAFEDGMQVMFSAPQLGDHHITRIPNGNPSTYILFADADMRGTGSFDCFTADSGIGYSVEDLTPVSYSTTSTKYVRVYLEVDYDVFISKGGATGTENYIKGLFNEVAALYARDNITVKLSQLYIWNTNNSPYPNSDIYSILRSFQAFRTTMNGDVGQLITYKGSGGIAVVDGLCRPSVSSRVGVSSIDNFYNKVPTYSFSVMVLAHEIGHILGSQHTHACVWNGTNTAIDGCAGATEGSCALPSIPSGGGTIMSYCHLTGAGINMLNGFGPQPKTLIQNRIAGAACLMSDPDDTTACQNVSLSLTLDQFGSETTWQVVNSKNQTVMSGGPYANKKAGTTVSASACLTPECYIFKINDSDGDGICCTYGNGSFLLKKTDKDSVIASGSQFSSSYTASFCVVRIDGPPPPPETCGIDFTKKIPKPFGGSQDAGTATVTPPSTLCLENNAWKMVDFPYTITPKTMLAFEFKSTKQGEVHGIGLDNDLFVTTQLTFQLYGTQAWGQQAYRDYDGSGEWKTYLIPVGKFYTGKAKYLFFAMDDDVTPALGNSCFRNVRVYEEGELCSNNLPGISKLPMEAPILPHGLNVYPNPASSDLNVRAEGFEDGQALLHIFNSLGQEVKTMPVQIVGGNLQTAVPLASFLDGNYTIQLSSGEQSMVQKFVIQR